MKKLDIIYEDKELLVVNKPTKLLCISDGKTDHTLYAMAREYVKKQHKSNKIFIVHRLDKDTSGVLVFAKTESVKKYLQDNWNKITKREYFAIVEGKLDSGGVIKEYLTEDKTHHVYAVNNPKKGEYAETEYEVIEKKKNVSVVKVNIKTGKRNQIRVGFADIGHPIVGDKKYGSKFNYLKRLGLHAYRLEIKYHDKKLKFIAKVPKEFNLDFDLRV